MTRSQTEALEISIAFRGLERLISGQLESALIDIRIRELISVIVIMLDHVIVHTKNIYYLV